METCPICREKHIPDRTLVFDGFGVNSCGMYRSRIATLQPDAPRNLGALFAYAPQLKQALRNIIDQDYNATLLMQADELLKQLDIEEAKQ